MPRPQGEVVVGSSDHALYVIDAAKGTKKRQLYNKSSGHQECEPWQASRHATSVAGCPAPLPRHVAVCACCIATGVTAVAFTPDGKIVSGGMDSQLWLWPANTTRGIKMDGHFGPVSHVQWDGHTGLVVSCSYGEPHVMGLRYEIERTWRSRCLGRKQRCLTRPAAKCRQDGAAVAVRVARRGKAVPARP